MGLGMSLGIGTRGVSMCKRSSVSAGERMIGK